MAAVVDANAHVISPLKERIAFPLSSLDGVRDQFSDDQTNGAEDFVALMDIAGVDQALLFNSRFHGFDNRYCATAVRRHSNRFVGIANIDVFNPDSPDLLSYWIEDEGLHGVRLWGGQMFNDKRACAVWVGDRKYDRLWSTLQELGVPFNAQKTFPECLLATRQLLERFSGIKLTINNLAQIPVSEGSSSDSFRQLLSLSEFPNVYVSFSVDFAADASRSDSNERQMLEQLLWSFGPSRLMWSAFYPSLRHRPYQDSIGAIRDALLFLSKSEQEQILGGSARSLYPSLVVSQHSRGGSS